MINLKKCDPYSSIKADRLDHLSTIHIQRIIISSSAAGSSDLHSPDDKQLVDTSGLRIPLYMYDVCIPLYMYHVCIPLYKYDV